MLLFWAWQWFIIPQDTSPGVQVYSLLHNKIITCVSSAHNYTHVIRLWAVCVFTRRLRHTLLAFQVMSKAGIVSVTLRCSAAFFRGPGNVIDKSTGRISPQFYISSVPDLSARWDPRKTRDIVLAQADGWEAGILWSENVQSSGWEQRNSFSSEGEK